LNGVDALLSIVQMPKGVPVGTLAIGEPGAANAALLAAAIVSRGRPQLRERLRTWRAGRAADVLAETDLTSRRQR
jgi:5-(carboxyamino)imidazole ribonucleotide mutase